MVNWADPAEIQRDSEVFVKLVFVCFGVYVWELFMTWDFEWSLITKRRKFRWPLGTFFFFFCRYCMLFALIGLLISLSVTTRVNCGALFTFNSWTGNMAILCASTSLMLRTIALWERKRSVVISLGILCLAHWALLYRTMFIVIAEWNDQVKTCVVVATNPGLLNTTFFFTMGFDLIILVFSGVALTIKHSARTGLWKLLFQDGLVYFLISFTCNSIPAVLNVLNLNQIMNVVATIPAATITSIAACRAVIRLLDFNNDVYVHTVSNNNTRQNATTKKFTLTRPEVHVTTEHITMGEFASAATTATQKAASIDFNSTDSPYEKDDKRSLDFARAS